MHGARALLSEGDVTIVDAAMVNLTEGAVLGDEYSGLRRNGHLGQVDERLAGIDDDVRATGKLRLVFANDGTPYLQDSDTPTKTLPGRVRTPARDVTFRVHSG